MSRWRPSARVLAAWWLVIVVVAGVVLAIGAHRATGGSSLSARTAAVASIVRCPVCDGLSVEDSTVPVAKSLKAEIRRKLAAGESAAQVESSLVARYGQSILLEPPRHGLSLLVWLIPVIAVIGAVAGLIAFALRRARREAEASRDEMELSDEERAEAEAELARLRGAPR